MLGLAGAASAQDAATDVAGSEALYRQHCASCHDGGVPRAANRATLSLLSSEQIRSALTSGSMVAQGAALTAQQRDMLAQHLGSKAVASASPSAGQCQKEEARGFAVSARQPQWNGWGAALNQQRFQPASMARLPAGQVPKLKLKWAFGFDGIGQGSAQPTIMGGRVFVGGVTGIVHSLSAASGCLYWTFKADFGVRTAITVGPQGRNWLAYFADMHANVYAVDAATGKLHWKLSVDPHPAARITGAPTLHAGVLYVPVSSSEEATGADPKYECCKFRGSVAAVDAISGKLLWQGYAIAEEPQPVRKNKQGVQLFGPSGAAVWSAPTVDTKSGNVYVTTGDSYSDPAASTSDAFVAFDLKTGKPSWASQMTQGDAYTVDCGFPEQYRSNCSLKPGPDHDFASSALLVNLPKGKRALIAGQKSGMVHAIDPDRAGAILWQTRVGEGGPMGGVQWGSAADANNVYVAVADAKVAAAPPGAAGGQPSLMGVPLMMDPKAGGGLYALRLGTGEIVWHTPHPGCGDKPGCSPPQSAAVTAIPGVVFSGGLDGHLRAYAADTGRIIWDMDTVQEYQTVNAVKAKGGSLDGSGPVVVDGTVYVNSGYLYLGSIPGNVLLAYSVDGK
jgi:polyvinyl alcohol dehydrogenase (cytochrome)